MTAPPLQRRVMALSASLDGLRILILEDEYLIAMDVEQICRDAGAADVAIVDSLAGFDTPAAFSFDAAILDLMLNGASTLPFAARLQREGVPFVFASGHGISDELNRDFPGVALVEKPYSGGDLIAAVAAALKVPPLQSAGDVIT